MKQQCSTTEPGYWAGVQGAPDLYISGAMRGHDDLNFPAFHDAEMRLHKAGFGVFSPARRDLAMYGDVINDDFFDVRAALECDMAWIAKHADGVAVIPGWEKSRGARAEVALALAIDIPVALVDSWVTRFQDPGLFMPKITEIPPISECVEAPEQVGYKGKKGSKVERFDLIPVRPLMALARHYGIGAKKYDDHNWELGVPWSLNYAAMQRHLNLFWSGVDIDVDPKTGERSPHLVAVAWHAFALLEYSLTHPELDDRVKQEGSLI